MKRYVAHVLREEMKVTLAGDSWKLNGLEILPEMTNIEAGTIRLRFQNCSYECHYHGIDDEGNTHVYVNGKHVLFTLDDEHSLLLKKFENTTTKKSHAATIKAPMPGKITKVLVSVGDAIKAGQGVLILEAMKMENELKASAAGVVQAIRVNETDTVEKNAFLIDIS